MTEEKASKNISSAFSARGNDALEVQYEEWADSYDADNAAMGFRLPILAAAFFARWVPANAGRILDAGCGTGLAADNLWILGYRDLVGIDLSHAMLAKAQQLGIFAELHRMVMGERLDFSTGAFAGAIVTGVFTEGHAPHSSFDELVRVVQPGGHIVFNVRDDIYEHHGFREKMDMLEADKRWIIAEKSDPFRPYTIGEEKIMARIFAYRVLA